MASSENSSTNEAKKQTNLWQEIKESLTNGKNDTIEFLKEFRQEALPPKSWFQAQIVSKNNFWEIVKPWIHIPYFPAFHQPGWLLKYAVGPYDQTWIESIISDVLAGITVGLTLVPQGLSYATLANIQPIQGLYAAVLPSAVYILYGSSLQLSVGPVAVVSLLTGQLVAQFVPNFSQPEYYQDASDLAAEVALAVGAVMTILAVFNMGNFVRYISHPVMSGFTSGE